MAPTTALWNPSQTLKLGPYSPEESSTCIGHAHSKNRRCHNPIAAANRQKASQLLDRIQRIDIKRNVDLTEDLEEIAARLLCTRWHKNQAPVVARRWMEEVEKLRTTAEGGRRRAVTATREGAVASVTTTATTARIISTTTVPRVAGAARTTASPQTTSPPRVTSAILTLASPTQRTLQSPPRPTPPTSAAPESPTRTKPPSSAAAPSLTPPPPLSSSASDPQPPATPTPLAEECPICYDDVHEDEQKTLSCEHSFHTVCIGAWFANQDGCSRPRTCPYCRVPPACPPPPAEECPICYDDVDDEEQKTLNCKHSFHTGCIKTWFANQDGCSRARTCPCCRHDEGNEWALGQEGD